MNSLPALPQLKELQLSDKPLVDTALAQAAPWQSELTFTNLYIWRHSYGIRLAQLGGALCLFALTPDPEDAFMFPPLGEADVRCVRACLDALGESAYAPRLARATAGDIERLGLSASQFDIELDRGNFDYVYRGEDLVKLPGTRYHSKRNHIVQFEARYPFFEYKPLTPQLVGRCLELQDMWCDEKHCDMVGTLRAEHLAVKQVLENLEPLGVTGGVIEVEGRIEAFSLGELLNADTVVIHIEKANGNIHGLYQVINQQFVAHEWAQCTYVNREQDLGVEGLRQAKLSYYPDHMVEKFVVRAL